MKEHTKGEIERRPLKFRIDGEPVVLAMERYENQRIERLYAGDNLIGTVQTQRGDPRVCYVLPEWTLPKVRHVGLGGKSKEGLMRECRRKIIEHAKETIEAS